MDIPFKELPELESITYKKNTMLAEILFSMKKISYETLNADALNNILDLHHNCISKITKLDDEYDSLLSGLDPQYSSLIKSNFQPEKLRGGELPEWSCYLHRKLTEQHVYLIAIKEQNEALRKWAEFSFDQIKHKIIDIRMQKKSNKTYFPFKQLIPNTYFEV